MREATHLTCSMHVKNYEEQCRLFGAGGFNFPVTNEFATPAGTRGRFYQSGGGLIEVVEYPDEPDPSWDFILSVGDLEEWRAGLQAAGYTPGELFEMPAGRVGFRATGPSGVRLRVRTLTDGDPPPPVPSSVGPNVVHFLVTWWPTDWEADHRFLEQGLGLVTGRGRAEVGRRIAFVRAAYGGRGILEILDPLNDPYATNGLHWRISLVVDDAASFHQRLGSGGFRVTDLELSPQGRPAFMTGTPMGPDVYVVQQPDGGMPGLLGEPLGLSMS